MESTLLVTKVRIPPARTRLVPRRRLFERLDEGLRRQLTLISAPAGFGKTTLAAEWANVTTATVAWLALDEDDNDPARFVVYLIAALREVRPELGETALQRLQSVHKAPPEQLLGDLINDLAAAAPLSRAPEDQFVLLLDDYHLIDDPRIHSALGYLLEHLPPQAHLVIVSRADPPLPLARLRARGQLVELRQGELRFTAGEATAFLTEVTELDLSPAQVQRLNGRTEGWIAGLQMAAVSLREQEDPAAFIAGFSGGHRYVLDFLLEEVLQRQPPEVQSFLLQTSILDRLTAPLCDALLSGGGEASPARPALEILDYLERRNLFLIPLDEERRWYRYHRLFRELLALRLQQTRPQQVALLHRRAGHWFAAHGEADEAIDHLLAAEDYPAAAELVAGIAEATVKSGRLVTLLRWVKALPPQTVDRYPDVAALYAWSLFVMAQPLREIEAVLERLVADGHDAARSGRAAAIRSYIAIFRAELPEAFELAAEALEKLPAGATFMRQLAGLALGTAAPALSHLDAGATSLEQVSAASEAGDNLIIAVLSLHSAAAQAVRAGDLAGAAATYRRALALAQDESGEPLPVAGKPLQGLGQVYLEWNDLAKAGTYLRQGIDLANKWSELASLEGYLVQVRYYRATDQDEQIPPILEKAARLARRFDASELDDQMVALTRVNDLLAAGAVGEARHIVDGWRRGADDAAFVAEVGRSPVVKYEYLALARLLLAERRLAEAQGLLQRLRPFVERCATRIKIELLMAISAAEQGEQAAAQAHLEAALFLGEPGGFVRLFVEEGAPVVPLLRTAAGIEGPCAAYAGRLLAAAQAESGAAGSRTAAAGDEDAVEPLSERELEVLSLIAGGLTNQQIADRLFLSLATVKWHTGNIYGKLAVGNRTEAVARARALGWLA